MKLPASALSVALLLSLPISAFGQQDVRKEFESMDQSDDTAGMVELWRENPRAALSVIDSYLEGSLRVVEKKGDAKEVAAMHTRALRGAKAASEAFDTPIFLDYASSFVGWSPEQQKSFRAGQAAFKAAAQALGSKDLEQAVAQGNECVRLARPLGDWWGTAMGLGILGQAEMQRGNAEAALEALSQARLINHDLRLLDDELECLLGMTDALLQLDRSPRAKASAEQGLALASAIGNAEAKKAFEERVAKSNSQPAK
jgi:tetratricopeptide (TPR) repeat protein